jgi:hypothetical protein
MGVMPHVMLAFLMVRSGTSMVFVPYRGAGQTITDLLSGHIQMTVLAKASALPHVLTDKLKALAVTSEARWLNSLTFRPCMTAVSLIFRLTNGSVCWPRQDACGRHRQAECFDQQRIEVQRTRMSLGEAGGGGKNRDAAGVPATSAR